MSGGFEVGDLLKIYCEKGNPGSWKDWMNLFLKEGNLIWHVEEANTVNTNPLLEVRTQGVLMRLINPENLNHESKESLKIDLDVPITCRGTLYFINDMIYYMTEDEGDLFYKLYSINPNAFLKKAGQPPFKVEKVSYGGRIPKHGETSEQNEFQEIIGFLEAIWGEEKEHWLQGSPENRHHKRGFMRSLWENGLTGSGIQLAPIAEQFDLEEETPLYNNIYKYTHPRPGQELDEGFSLPTIGGGRKKRRKRRKTKTKKSKTKKTRRRKSKKK